MARDAAIELAGKDSVGDHLEFVLEGERLGSHLFQCNDPGYRGWNWCVTLARIPRGRVATVCEVALQPGRGALLAPPWVPWASRLRPGDLGPNDVLPYIADDDRLVTQQQPDPTDDDEDGEGPDGDEAPPADLGGRRRVLSPQGRAAAAERWYAGDFGPRSARAKRASAKCGSCGFLLALAGSTRTMFGVCANEWSPADGHVVSLDHGCGAHSETDVPHTASQWQQSEPVINEMDIDIITPAPTS
ncbi:MAG: DUF3027 domain-containing protein [Bowdeniella nasicola]|nr:DUF3027 domain-containing protein [Bowdeniella nasicola]